MTVRWPLHPAPVDGEALTSWLRRIARQYDLSENDLVVDLGYVPDRTVQLDVAAPDGVVDQLALRTGVSRDRIQMMSLSGYTPWLIDDLAPVPDGFSTYTRQLAVLLPAGRRRDRTAASWRAWTSSPGSQRQRLCPQCVAEAAVPRPYLLAWSWPLLLTCPLHHCFLESHEGARGYYFWMGARPPQPRPLPDDHPVSVMDERTWQALTIGYVDLPRRRVHAGIWFRLLRTIIDELGATRSECGAAQCLIQAVWEHLDYPFRAGQRSWRPYERLSFIQQQHTLQAAAAAMHLLETGVLTGRGPDAVLFLPEPETFVPPGRLVRKKPPVKQEPSAAELMQKAYDSLDAMIDKARYDPVTAQHFLELMTYPPGDEDSRQHVRNSLTHLGIPLEFLAP